MSLIDQLRSEVADHIDDVVELRRAIHRHPELGIDNPATQRRIVDALEGLGLDVHVGEGQISSVVADLHGASPGPVFLLRADTDALPMHEESGEPFSSEVGGRAHACGHDAHVAMLVGAARILAGRRDEVEGTIRFMFQPGEEGSGGAAHMIDEGVMTLPDGRAVEAAFAIHITPNAPTGVVAARPGPLLAATDDFEVVVHGRGSHASSPHMGIDPLPVACEIVTALQTFVTRRVDAFNPIVLTVAQIHAGTATNVIAEHANLNGTIRSVSPESRARAVLGFDRIVRNIAAAHECEVEIDLQQGYPVTVNDGGFLAFVEGVIGDVMGQGSYFELPTPLMGAEDFSYVIDRVPGAMVFLGACPPEIENFLDAPSCHSNLMRIDEAAFAHGVALHVAVALAYSRR